MKRLKIMTEQWNVSRREKLTEEVYNYSSFSFLSQTVKMFVDFFQFSSHV